MSRRFHLRNVLVVAGSIAMVFALAALGAYAQGSRVPDTLAPAAPGVTLTTAISYQGRLLSGGAPVNGTCDLVFAVFDAASGGAQVVSTVAETLAVSGGLFTAPLDFGASAFNGQARWLATQVRCPAGGGAYTPLLPRQPLLPAPQALSLVPGALISAD